MAGIRGKKTRKAKTIKILRNTRKKKKKINPSIGDSVLRQHWDTSKTLQQNLKGLGLAYDANNSVPIPKQKKITRKDLLREDQGVSTMEVEKPEINTAVIEAFEERAANGKKLERHIAPGEAKFVLELINKHGANYKQISNNHWLLLSSPALNVLSLNIVDFYRKQLLSKDVGIEFQKMYKDKRNTHQHTPKQLKRKCEALLKSSLLPKYKEMFPGLLPEDTMEMND